jgi:HSP90 family molecular chaperone
VELDDRYRLFHVPTEAEQALFDRFAVTLGRRVSLVQATRGLDQDTPCVLVLRSVCPCGNPEEEVWDETMARQTQAQRLVLQLNMKNAIIRRLTELVPLPAHSGIVTKVVRILYNTGLVACHLLPERDLRIDDLVSLTVPPESVEVIEY